MPITPHFTLRQTDTFIDIILRIPHVRVRADATEVVLTDKDSTVHIACPPIYLLVLHFAPHQFQADGFCSSSSTSDDDGVEVRENDGACITYDPASMELTVRLAKKVPFEWWEHLDLRRNLVSAKVPSSQQKPQQQPSTCGVKWLQEVQREDHRTDWTNQQSIPDGQEHHEEMTASNSCGGYGFLRMFHGIFTDLVRDGLAKEMLEMRWQEEHESLQCHNEEDRSNNLRLQRKHTRLEKERRDFSAERYLQDLELQDDDNDDYIYSCAMNMSPHWKTGRALSASSLDSLCDNLESTLSISKDKDKNKKTDGRSSTDTMFFAEPERAMLTSLPYPLLPNTIPKEQEKALFLGLLDILFAYTYDHLLTDAEPTVESAWTVTTLSISLSWLEDYYDSSNNNNNNNNNKVIHVVTTSIRRALIYPYIRNLDFAKYVWQNVSLILRAGLRTVIRSMMQTRSMLDHSDLYYLGNKIYLDPYLAWIQARHEHVTKQLPALAQAIDKALAEPALKDMIDLDLETIEKEAEQMLHADDSSKEDDSDGDTTTDSSSQSEESRGSQSELDHNNDDKEEVTKAAVSHERQHVIEQPPQNISSELADDAMLMASPSPFLFVGSLDPSRTTTHDKMNKTVEKSGPKIVIMKDD